MGVSTVVELAQKGVVFTGLPCLVKYSIALTAEINKRDAGNLVLFLSAFNGLIMVCLPQYYCKQTHISPSHSEKKV